MQFISIVTETVYGEMSGGTHVETGVTDIKEWINIGSTFFTTLFTIFLFFLTKSSMSMAKNSKIRQDAEDTALSSVYRKQIIKKAEYLHNTVFGQSSKYDPATLRNAPRTHELTQLELVRYFDDRERGIIEKIWELYLNYYSNYWFDSKTNDISDNMNGHSQETVNEASRKVAGEIKKLIDQL